MDAAEPKTLDERLAALLLSPFAVWVLDTVERRIAWANPSALELWHSPSREELCGRSLGIAPKAVMTRLDALFARVSAGEAFWEDWTFYPKGAPTPVKLHCQSIQLDHGGLGILHHAFVREAGLDPALLRGIEALKHTSVIVALADFEGKLVMKNTALLEAFGHEQDDWKAFLADSQEAAELLRLAAAGEVARREVRVRDIQGEERIHLVELRALRDAVTGQMMALIHHTDETARLGAEASAERHKRLAEELDHSLSVVEAQRREILTLSAPLLDIGEGALAIPIVGALDRERVLDIEGRLLPQIAARSCRMVILDMTGAAFFSAQDAEPLTRILSAIRLLGARPVMTGIGQSLARSMIESGFVPEAMLTLRTLADGIRLARSKAY